LNWEAIGAIGEIVGAAAVVVTLIYLALQVRLSREATLAHTRSLRSSARIESGRYWTEEVIRMALSPDMAMIVSQGMSDARQLSDEERERLVAWYTQHMIAKDNLYHQYLDGLLPEDSWEAHVQVTKGVLKYDSFLRTWDAGYIPVSEAFRAYVEQLRVEGSGSDWSFDSKARIFD
jgi:hypothetical protein